MLHSERGAMELSDVVTSNAHDAFHRRWDLTRILHQFGAAEAITIPASGAPAQAVRTSGPSFVTTIECSN